MKYLLLCIMFVQIQCLYFIQDYPFGITSKSVIKKLIEFRIVCCNIKVLTLREICRSLLCGSGLAGGSGSSLGLPPTRSWSLHLLCIIYCTLHQYTDHSLYLWSYSIKLLNFAKIVQTFKVNTEAQIGLVQRSLTLLSFMYNSTF